MNATREDLKSLQSESLNYKILRTMGLIDEWYSRLNDKVYVSFSGGKDSTVLADLCAEYCSKRQIPLHLVFVDTGLEYPEVRQHVKDFAEFRRGGGNTELMWNWKFCIPSCHFQKLSDSTDIPYSVRNCLKKSMKQDEIRTQK